MKVFSPLVCLLMFFCGCATPSPDTTKLQVGMTKEDVVKVMGKPNRAVVDKGKDVFIYRLTVATVTQRTINWKAGTPAKTPLESVNGRNIDSRNKAFHENPFKGGSSSTPMTSSSTYVQKEKYAVVFEKDKVTAFGWKRELGVSD